VHNTIATDLSMLVGRYGSEDGAYTLKEWSLQRGQLSDFHQWADARPCKGAFSIVAPGKSPLWLVIVDWKKTGNYYVVMFPDSRVGPLAEIHECSSEGDEHTLHWNYSPTKHDGRNPERRAYFAEAFKSTEVFISLPKSVAQVEEFFDELFSLVTSRQKADELDPSRPVPREGFPEGKLKERLHLARERNAEVIRQAKRLAMQHDGRLRCACCKFDFEQVYGSLGKDFIEAHHTKPLSTLHADGELTRVEDLALVCSNCHRMLHRRRPWLGLTELGKLLEKT
jgi:hypothetical protein